MEKPTCWVWSGRRRHCAVDAVVVRRRLSCFRPCLSDRSTTVWHSLYRRRSAQSPKTAHWCLRRPVERGRDIAVNSSADWWCTFPGVTHRIQLRVVHGSIYIDPARPSQLHDWPDPTQPMARWTCGPNIQPNAYPPETPYIKQQLACHKNNAPNPKANLPVATRYKVTYIHDLPISFCAILR